MAIYWTKPTTFAEVEAIYNNTKPMRGKNKDKDVRPIGDRARDHERIKKISSNCYLLMNGGYYDDVFQWYYFRGKPAIPTQAEMVALAPICWKRHKDGTETITVRNGIGNGAHMSHYSFLDRMLPRGMGFFIQNGKQYIRVDAGEALYLPKCMYVPRHIFDQERIRYTEWMRATDDGSSLTFKRGEHGFTLVGDARDAPKPPRKVVKKGQKARYKQAIANFREWAFAVGPMLEISWETRNQMQTEFRELFGEFDPDYVSRNYIDLMNIPANIAIRILTDYNNTMRLHMLYSFVYYSDMKSIQTEEDVKHVKAQFNRWINKTCGFTKTVKG
jgi:hypothetical protein